jgi:hypothetical protein
MLNNAQSFFTRAPWLVFAPGVVIALTVWCLFILGDGLRDALDPSTSRSRTTADRDAQRLQAELIAPRRRWRPAPADPRRGPAARLDTA